MKRFSGPRRRRQVSAPSCITSALWQEKASVSLRGRPVHVERVSIVDPPSVALLLLLCRLAAHAFHRLRLAGDSDVGARDLAGVAPAGDAAIGPLRASRQLRLHGRIVRRHGRFGRRLWHDVGGRQCLFGRATRARRRRFGSAGRKRRHDRSDEHERAATSADPTSRQRKQHHIVFISSQSNNNAFFGEAGALILRHS